jgi:hypothetical protein
VRRRPVLFMTPAAGATDNLSITAGIDHAIANGEVQRQQGQVGERGVTRTTPPADLLPLLERSMRSQGCQADELNEAQHRRADLPAGRAGVKQLTSPEGAHSRCAQ